jgi:hypothetical protein
LLIPLVACRLRDLDEIVIEERRRVLILQFPLPELLLFPAELQSFSKIIILWVSGSSSALALPPIFLFLRLAGFDCELVLGILLVGALGSVRSAAAGLLLGPSKLLDASDSRLPIPPIAALAPQPLLVEDQRRQFFGGHAD